MKKIVISLCIVALILLGLQACKSNKQEKDRTATATEKTGSKSELIIFTNNGKKDSVYARLFSPYNFELLSILAICVLTTSIVYFVTRLLDRIFAWRPMLFSRVVLQILLGIALPSSISYLLVAIAFQLLNVDMLTIDKYMLALPFIVILTTGFNVYYNVLHLISGNAIIPVKMGSSPKSSKEQLLDVDTNKPAEVNSTKFLVHTPTGSFPLPIAEIAYFYRRRGYVYLRRINGTDHIVAQSLDQIQQEVPEAIFFRAARHMLASYNSICEYYPLHYGKLGIHLNPSFKEEITISKLLAKDFKTWMDR